MKRRVGDGGRRTTVLAPTKEEKRTEMEDLCSKLVSLIPQDSLLVDKGSSDLPSQLMHATTYIKNLEERVTQLKQRRDNCYEKIQQATNNSDVNNNDTTATPESCLQSQNIIIQFDKPENFDVNLTMNSKNHIELYMVIHMIEEDRCIEIIEASSCLVEGYKTVHIIKCRARSSGDVLDVSQVETRVKRLLMTSLTKLNLGT